MLFEADWCMLVNKGQTTNGGDQLDVFCQVEAKVLADGGGPSLSQMHLSSKEQLQLSEEQRVVQPSFMSKQEVLEK